MAFLLLLSHLPIKTLYFVGYPAILALGIMIIQTLLPNLHWSCFVPRLVYPILILNIKLTSILFFLMARLCGREQVLGDWQSSYRIDKNCLVSRSHRSCISKPFIHLEERIFTSVIPVLSVYSDSSPHFGGVRFFCSRKEIYVW